MSGHSKWANIKHRKEKADAQKGAAFTKAARELMVAVKQGGGPDPESNFRLRMAIQSAKEVNMPNDSIQRAIKRAAGASDAENYEEIVYEGYGPGGTAIIVEAMTDNRNRTASDVRYLFSKHGGNLGETGCVGWMFDRKGVITIDKERFPDGEESLMLLAIDAGAEDMRVWDEYYEVLTAPEDLEPVRRALEREGVALKSARLEMIAKTTVTLELPEAAQALKLIEAIEDHDDVQRTYSNIDIPDDVAEQVNRG